jgi:hypothetical protein
MDISGGVDSAADLVDQGLTSTPVRSSFQFFPHPFPQLPQHAATAAADVENRYRTLCDRLEIAQIVIEFLKGNRIGPAVRSPCCAG